MSQYLILHKVRGEPSFDCAEKIMIGDEEGWITNSGYRAYPIWQAELPTLLEDAHTSMTDGYLAHKIATMPADWPDHFEVRKEAPKVMVGLGELMAMVMPKLKRRI